jgi:5-methyltetrahydrofolate--homocysteine methyltransferase
VNSVNAEKSQLESILPIVKGRGAAVIGLTLAEGGIPKTAEERLSAAGKIIEHAAKLGIPVEDVILDPLVMTVGSDSKAAQVTLKTIKLVRKEYGANINLGASNVSFGLPDRSTVNQAFLAMAIQAGATCSITDPIKLGATIRASDVLIGRDDFAMRYIKYFRAAEALREKESNPVAA